MLKKNGKRYTNSIEITNEINKNLLILPQNLKKNIKVNETKTKIIKKIMLNSMNNLKTASGNIKYKDIISYEKILEIIKKLNPKKAFGFDEIDQKMFINAPKISSLYLNCLFRKILQLNKMPNLLNTSKVIPIPKTLGDELEVNQIRPIALLSVVSKILEKLILTKLEKIIYKNNILSKNQTGFIRNKSTLNNIIKTHDKIFNGLKNKTNMIIASIDLTKAYDTIDRNYLLQILEKLGIDGIIKNYLLMFLKNRKQLVHYNNTYSQVEKSVYGLPQGSCISPILFNIYLNVILIHFKKSMDIRAFADDLIIYFENQNINKMKKIIELKLNNLNDYMNSINLHISFQKSKLMHVTNLKKTNTPTIKIANNQINYADEFKYLGIIFDKRLKFDSHLKSVLSRVKKKLGILQYLNSKIKGAKKEYLLTIYKSFIRPVMEYGYPILGNITKSRVKRLESFQHTALCRILNINIKTSYLCILSSINMLNMSNRYVYLMIKLLNKKMLSKKDYTRINYEPFYKKFNTNSYIKTIMTYLTEKNKISEYKNPNNLKKCIINYQFEKFSVNNQMYNENTKFSIEVIKYFNKKKIKTYGTL